MKNCITHHLACSCREELIKTVCDALIETHEKSAEKMSRDGTFRMIRSKCSCLACEAARQLLNIYEKGGGND